MKMLLDSEMLIAFVVFWGILFLIFSSFIVAVRSCEYQKAIQSSLIKYPLFFSWIVTSIAIVFPFCLLWQMFFCILLVVLLEHRIILSTRHSLFLNNNCNNCHCVNCISIRQRMHVYSLLIYSVSLLITVISTCLLVCKYSGLASTPQEHILLGTVFTFIMITHVVYYMLYYLAIFHVEYLRHFSFLNPTIQNTVIKSIFPTMIFMSVTIVGILVYHLCFPTFFHKLILQVVSLSPR